MIFTDFNVWRVQLDSALKTTEVNMRNTIKKRNTLPHAFLLQPGSCSARKLLSTGLLLLASYACTPTETPPEDVPNCEQLPDYTSTYAAIQGVVFEKYGCTNSLCHGQAPFAGNLDLTAANSYTNLVGAAASGSSLVRVEPSSHELSYLYEKLRAATEGTSTTGSPMPTGGLSPLSSSHLAAVHLWIDAGAPQTGIVVGTEPMLAACPSSVAPNKIPTPDAPGASIGVQIQSTAWKLAKQDEDEVCFASYYDFTKTNLIPASEQINCPAELITINNPSGKCFQYHRQELRQDPLSHHAVNNLYTGAYDLNSFGPFTYKANDLADPRNGLTCDPTVVDPTTGRHQDCSGAVRSGAACIGYGPPDYIAANRHPLVGAQSPVTDESFASGVYDVMPMSGIVVWNSHAFNLSQYDATMAQYMNLYLSSPSDKLYQVENLFDTSNIFYPDVAPFSTQEVCATVTLDVGTNLFQLTSHTHQWGVRFRIWSPPNAACGPANCVPGPASRLIYTSTEYSDPAILNLTPPVVLSSANAEDRTYLFCSLYDNGSTASSPPVKQQSTSVEPNPASLPGGPCDNTAVACMAGPNKGNLCYGVNANCDSSPGAGDGLCDACPVVGGVTSTDEMFIPIGLFYKK